MRPQLTYTLEGENAIYIMPLFLLLDSVLLRLWLTLRPMMFLNVIDMSD